MLQAARAHGSPTMVTAMITAAISQPIAISRPPNRIQSRLNRKAMADMECLQFGRGVVPLRRRCSYGSCPPLGLRAGRRNKSRAPASLSRHRHIRGAECLLHPHTGDHRMGNPFVHMELMSSDLPKVKSFYGKLFDWELEDMPAG